MADLEIPTELLESPSFQLERLRRRTRDAVESQISAKHVSLREYWVLSCLMSTDATSQSALCEVLAYDASDMVRLVGRPGRKRGVGGSGERGFQGSRRRTLCVPTKRGRRQQAELSKLVNQAEDSALYESTSKQLKYLRKLAHAIIAAEAD